ncbi:MAG: hypothetical protein VX988_01105 [Planctomycetota bacterium]|nr:hypothetical protein [Planctomycetota bacterium]
MSGSMIGTWPEVGTSTFTAAAKHTRAGRTMTDGWKAECPGTIMLVRSIEHVGAIDRGSSSSAVI